MPENEIRRLFPDIGLRLPDTQEERIGKLLEAILDRPLKEGEIWPAAGRWFALQRMDLGNLTPAQAIAYLKDALAERNHKKAPPTAPQAREPATLWYHGERQYSIDRVTPLKVSDEVDSILQAFLESQAAMETSDITDKAGVTNVSRAMQTLATWNGGIFKLAVRNPKGKAKGGYFIRVKKL